MLSRNNYEESLSKAMERNWIAFIDTNNVFYLAKRQHLELMILCHIDPSRATNQICSGTIY